MNSGQYGSFLPKVRLHKILHTLYVPFGTVSLIQTENKKLIATMTVSGNLSISSAPDWTDQPCKRNDMLFKASIGGEHTDINCVTINHITNFMGNPGGKVAELYTYLKTQEIDLPPTVLRISFVRYSDRSRRLSVVLTINPEVLGFKRETESWGRNAWHKTQAMNDPEKKRFIDALGIWALGFAKQMDVAFDGDKKAFNAIPSWRSVMDMPSKRNPA